MTKTQKNIKGASHNPQIKQLKRVEGQVRGVIKMIEDERYCIDIITQIKAIRASLATVERKVVGEHLSHCVHGAISSKNSKRTSEMMEEIKDLLKKVNG